MTEIIFKKDVKNDNEIIAFMPYEIQNWQGQFLCYAHIGQHSNSEYGYYKQCKNASYNEYKELLTELKQIGYDVQIQNRINTKRFKQAYQDFLERDRILRINKSIK